MTVFLTTHYMEEADQLCQRVAFISEGKIVAEDAPQNLKIRYGEKKATVTLRGEEIERTVSLDNPDDAALLQSWMEADRVMTIHSREATLEEVFIQIAGRPLE